MQTSSASVLIVDDSATMRSILRDMLARLGFRSVEEAADGKAALAKVQARNFSLIISDWHMEPMSGIELLREVRRISTPGVNRFVLATTERAWSSQTTAKIDGVDAYLIKPFTIGDLQTKLELVLRR